MEPLSLMIPQQPRLSLYSSARPPICLVLRSRARAQRATEVISAEVIMEMRTCDHDDIMMTIHISARSSAVNTVRSSTSSMAVSSVSHVTGP